MLARGEGFFLATNRFDVILFSGSGHPAIGDDPLDADLAGDRDVAAFGVAEHFGE
ncbi:MAG: hypothetical protein IPP47_23045 [Bryobacterales bacterium]|nr:hypothetical protein [Bryobacterales bacterium]